MTKAKLYFTEGDPQEINDLEVGNLIVSGILTASSFSGSSDIWTRTSSGIHTLSNVGIGTTNPDFALDVNGLARFVNTFADIRLLNNYSSTAQGYRFALDGNSPNNLYLQRSTNNFVTASDVFVVDGNSNLLINTSIPTGTASQPLQVAGSAYISGNLGVGNGAPTAKLDISSGLSTDTVPELRVGGYGFIDFHNRAGSENYNPIVQTDDKSIIFSNGSIGTGNLVIAPWAATAGGIRITNAGDVGVGVTTPARRFHVNGGMRNTARNAASTQTALHINTTTGDIAETASSRRFKRNIEDYTKGLDTLIQLRPVSFNFLEDDLPNTGLIAEEVHEIGLPEFIRYDADEKPYSIPYDNLSALYINAIKDLKAENDLLKARLDALEAYVGFSTTLDTST